MYVPMNWLADYVVPGLSLRDLVDRLDLTGTKVEGLHHHGVDALEHFVVGKVLSAEQHPDADRLTVCTVDVGTGAAQQIVCGAPNVAAGQTVAVARPGAVMPDGTKLGVARLRGIESNGMICAEDELGIGTLHAGTMVLDDGLAAGTPLADVLPISTDVLELEITPNRADCLGLYGVAREIHAVTGDALGPPPWREDPGPEPGPISGIDIRVEVPELCPRFTARLFEGVTIAESPSWLKARLMAADQRPINNVVDITNYVMLLVGQPLHAFDADRIAGGQLIVRRAGNGETMTTLDDVARTLDPDMVLIADADGPTSIAGIMGGQRSEVSDSTTRVLLEVASWDGPNINRTMARLQLRSEAGARFEKSLPVETTMWAQAVATKLMVELTGATVVGGTIDVAEPFPGSRTLRVRQAKVASLLGVEVDAGEAALALERLGFEVRRVEGALEVEVPPHRRADVSREADLIEEIGRLLTLDRLPSTLPANRTGQAAVLTDLQQLRRRAADALVGRGVREAVGWSFTSTEVDDRLGLPAGDPRRAHVELENPMSEEQAVLRTTLVGSLLDVARLNAARGPGAVAVFEEGAVYAARAGTGDDGRPALPAETHALALLVPGDVFAAKGFLDAVATAVRARVEVEQATEPFLHPGRTGRVLAGGEPVGWLGEVHPTVAARWDVGQVSGFEVDLDALLAHADSAPQFQDLTTFPALRQDLAFVLAPDVPAARLTAVVREAGGGLLADAAVFDVYTGPGIPQDRRSLAIALEFRAPDRTLTDEDVAPVRERIVAAVTSQLGGELRA